MGQASILFINRVYPPERGATGRVLRDLSREFVRQGWRVTVLTTGQCAAQESDKGVLIRRIRAPQNPRGMFAYGYIWLRLALAALRLARRDMVVSMTDPPMQILIGGLFARVKGAAHIHWCQDLYPGLLPALGLSLPRFLVNILQKWSVNAMNRSDGVVAIGRCMQEKLSLQGVIPERVIFIPNWADPELTDQKALAEDGESPDMDRSVLKRDPALKFRILYAGNIGRAHPVKVIVDAAEKLMPHEDIEFVFAGDTPGHERLARERDKRGLTNLKFIPYQPQERLRNLLESADIHLVSMRCEAEGYLVPCKLYSALAVARPLICIGPREGELSHVIRDYNAGSLVDPDDTDGLAQAILKYRLDGEAWFQAQEGARAAHQNFKREDALQHWIAQANMVIGADT